MSHVSALAIEDFVMGRLVDAAWFEAHVDRCVRCAQRLAEAARDELSLRALAREQRCGTAVEMRVGSRLPAPGLTVRSRNSARTEPGESVQPERSRGPLHQRPRARGERGSVGEHRAAVARRPGSSGGQEPGAGSPPRAPPRLGVWSAAAVVAALAAAFFFFASVGAGLSAALPAHAEAPAGGLALDAGVPEPSFPPPGALARIDGG